MGLRDWLIRILTKEREKKIKEHNAFLGSLPQEVRLLKDLPGVKAGITLALNGEGLYVHNGKSNIIYDHLTVTTYSDWFRPLNAEDKGRWFDG
jgi:hypothetical protein